MKLPNLSKLSLSLSTVSANVVRLLRKQNPGKSDGDILGGIISDVFLSGVGIDFRCYLQTDLHRHPGGGTRSRLCGKKKAKQHFTPLLTPAAQKCFRIIYQDAVAKCGKTLSVTEFIEALYLSRCPKPELRKLIHSLDSNRLSANGCEACTQNCVQVACIFTGRSGSGSSLL
jgi:hypothetical protein